MDELITIIKGLQSRIDTLEKLFQIKTLKFPVDGVLVIPSYTVDPVSPADGEFWYNSTSHKYKGCENGTIKTFTTS